MKKIIIFVLILIASLVALTVYRGAKADDNSNARVGTHSPYVTQCNPKPIDDTAKGDKLHALQAQEQAEQQQIINVAKQMEAYNDKTQGSELKDLTAKYYALLAKYDDCTTKPVAH